MNLEAVWSRVLKDTPIGYYTVHGPNHWARVERNGLYIAEKTGANKTIVQLFAVFHDCMRLNQDIDHGHGQRGAEYALQIKDELINISESDFDKLYYACEWHTDQQMIDDVTIAACWDADRLDLRRVGCELDPQFMNSKPAQEMVETDDFVGLDRIEVRDWVKLTYPPSQGQSDFRLESGVGCALDSDFEEDRVDWSRLAEPQVDEYDTNVVLKYAASAGQIRPEVEDNPTVFSGNVAVRSPKDCYKIISYWKLAPLDDPNLGYAVDMVKCWPEVYRQFSQVVHTIHPFSEPNLGGGSCSSHVEDLSGRIILGAINVTVFDPIGTSEALVHELAHQKLFALGVEFESSKRLIFNPPTELYPSPVRKNKRPMTAVVHATYAWYYIVNLQLKMIAAEYEKETDPQVLQVFAHRYFARNVLNLKKGFGVIQRNVKCDEVGRDFFGGFFDWGSRLIRESSEVLRNLEKVV